MLDLLGMGFSQNTNLICLEEGEYHHINGLG